MKVHFICRGNVLRSLIAETYLRSLNIDGVEAISSGTNVHWDDPRERDYFANTVAVLEKHGINAYAKKAPDQLTQSRIDEYGDVVVLMNDRVMDEASKLVRLPGDLHNWMIVDIGEGQRTDRGKLKEYEEEIYQEIIKKVDALFPTR